MFKEYVSKLRLLSRDIWLLLATSALLGFTVFGGIYSVLLNLYLLRLGYGDRRHAVRDAYVHPQPFLDFQRFFSD